jgi:hypothetical protein
MKVIQMFDELLVSFIKTLAGNFINTKPGKIFLSLVLVGPLTFIQTAWEAWFAPNIDALRTLTWPMLVIINLSVLVALCYNGDWRTRLSMVMWIILMLLVWLATVFR